MMMSSKSSALASRSLAWYIVYAWASVFSKPSAAWPAKVSSSISSFFRLDTLALNDFGGNRLGSRSRSRQTRAIRRLESAAS